MSAPRKVTDEMIIEINKLYDEGKGYVEVGQMLKLDAKTIGKHVKNKRRIGRPNNINCFTDEEIAEINRLYDEGMSCKNLAKLFYVSAPIMRKYIKKPVNSYGSLNFTIKDLQEINKLYDEGKTIAQIATIYNCSSGSISSRIWKPRSRGYRGNI